MGDEDAQARRDGELLSAALRSIRRRRGLRADEVARRMQLSKRTYQHFEAGDGRPNIDYIHRFASATESDPYAILFGLIMGSSDFAARCSDNKLMRAFMITLQEFDANLGPKVADVDVRVAMSAFTKAFSAIADEVNLAQSQAEDWLRSGQDALDAKRPGPGR